MTPPKVVISEDAFSNLQLSQNFSFIVANIINLTKAKQYRDQCKELSRIVEIVKTEQFTDLRPSFVESLMNILLSNDNESFAELDLQSNFFKLVISAILNLQFDRIYYLFDSGQNLSIKKSIKWALVLHLTLEKLTAMNSDEFQDILTRKLPTLLKTFARSIRIVSNAALSKDKYNSEVLSRDSFRLQGLMRNFLQNPLVTIIITSNDVYEALEELELVLNSCNYNNEDIFWGGIKGIVKLHSLLLNKILFNENEIERYLTGKRSTKNFNIEKAPLYLKIAISISMLEFIAQSNLEVIDTVLQNILNWLQQGDPADSQNYRQMCMYICFEVNILLKKSNNSITRAFQILLYMLQETPISEEKACFDLFSTIISSLNNNKELLHSEVHSMLNSIYTMKKMKVTALSTKKVKCSLLSCLISAERSYFEEYLIIDPNFLNNLVKLLIFEHDVTAFLNLLDNILDKTSVSIVNLILFVITDLTVPLLNLKNIIKCVPIIFTKRQKQFFELLEVIINSQHSYDLTSRYYIVLFSLLQFCKSKEMLSVGLRVQLNDIYVDVGSEIVKRGLAHIDEVVGMSALNLIVLPCGSKEWLFFELDVIKSVLPIRSDYCLLNSIYINELSQLIFQFNEKIIAHKFTDFGKFEAYSKWFSDFCLDLLRHQRTSDSKALGLKLLNNLLATVHKYSQSNPNCICILQHTLTKEYFTELLKLITERFEYIRLGAFNILKQYPSASFVDPNIATTIFNQGQLLLNSNWTPHSDAGAKLLALLTYSLPSEVQHELFDSDNLLLFILNNLKRNYKLALQDIKNITKYPLHGSIAAVKYCLENIENDCHFQLFPVLRNIFDISFEPLRYTPNANENNYDNQFTISCWYTIKELTSLFVLLAEKAPIADIEAMSEIFMDIFLHTKHNGILETGFQHFRLFCNNLKTIPVEWIEIFLEKIKADKSIFLSTSPISGPAYWFVSIMSNMLADYNLKCYVEEIIRIASQTTNERSQIISVNIVQALAKDSDINLQFAPFVEHCLILVCNNLNSSNWEVRSVSLMLYGVLIAKLKSEMLTFPEFSKKYPLAFKHFRLEVESIVNNDNYLSAILGIWSILTPSITGQTDTSLISLLQDIGKKSKSFYIRQSIANTILSIIPISEYTILMFNLFNSIPERDILQISSNELHFILQLILATTEKSTKNSELENKALQIMETKTLLLLTPNVHPICQSLFLKILLKFSPTSNPKLYQIIESLPYRMQSTMLFDVGIKYCYIWILKKNCCEDTLFNLLNETTDVECRRKLLKEFYKALKKQNTHQMSNEGATIITSLFIEENDPVCKIYQLKMLRRFAQSTHSSQLFGIAISKLNSESHYDVICQSLLLLTYIIRDTTQLEAWVKIIEKFSARDNVRLRLAAVESIKMFLISNTIVKLYYIILNLCMDTDSTIRIEIYRCLHRYYFSNKDIQLQTNPQFQQLVLDTCLQKLTGAITTDTNRNEALFPTIDIRGVDYDPSLIISICNLLVPK